MRNQIYDSHSIRRSVRISPEDAQMVYDHLMRESKELQQRYAKNFQTLRM
ncbi:MAG: hypothetical protein WC548_01005 [Candidatus Pacearchaeota archaeon]